MSPSLELMGAIVARLKSDAGLASVVGSRVYDTIPNTAAFPYISFGASWENPDDVDCIGALEIGFRIDVWSRSVGFPEARRIAEMVRRSLRDTDLTLNENALAMLGHERTDVLRDPDGLTLHIVLEFSATVETA